MPAAAARAASAYQQTQVQSCSPLEQVVLLYDGAIRFLTAAREAMDRHDLQARHRGISNALGVVNYLQSTLNMTEGGEVATRLDALYTYIRGLILDGNLRHEPGPIDEARQLLDVLRDGWAQIAKNPPGPVAVDRGQA
ncbi:MAG: flagellar export chaperone FliS [Acidobacteriota bacterium]|nr:flagellar export chaperone FliS [Acidobacteriota bacterium]